MELTCTNRPMTFNTQYSQYFTGMIIMLFAFTIRLRDNNLKPKNTWLLHDTGKHDQDDWFVCFVIVTAVIAWGKRPVPYRTRKLRPTAPMVLHS